MKSDTIEQLARAMVLPNPLKVPSYLEIVSGLKKLEQNHKDILRLVMDGRSRMGKELVCVEIGSGVEVIAITAGAHSDEPTGTVTAFYLCRNLVENLAFIELLSQYTFLIHPMLDPDGAELNYRWTSKVFSYREYLMHHYRNGLPQDDCEHGIPVSETQVARPESAFFKKNIDRFRGRLKFYITMHTTHRLGGSLFILSKNGDHSVRIKTLTDICKNFGAPVIDMDLHGMDGIERIAPGFLSAPPMSEMAEKLKDRPEIYSQIKMPTYEYAETICGSPFCMISELPYVIDENLKNTVESNRSFVDVKRLELEKKRARLPRLVAAIEELKKIGINEENLWFRNAVFSSQVAESSIEGELKQLSRFEGVRASNWEVSELETMDLESELKLHQLYIKTLEDRTDSKNLLDEHLNKFDQCYRNLESIIRIETLSLEDQVRLQAAMVFSGI